MKFKKGLETVKEEVLNSLDYHKIREAIEFLDLRDGKVPTICDLYQEVSDGLNHVVELYEDYKTNKDPNIDEYTVRTGGFIYTYYPETELDSAGFVVSFNVEYYNTFE